MTVNPAGAARAWLALNRKGLDLPVRRRHRVYADVAVLSDPSATITSTEPL